MSEVIISPPGTTEPVFGLQIFNEELVFVEQLSDGTVTVDASSLTTDVTIVAEDPFDATSYSITTGSGDDTVITAAGDDSISAGLGDDFAFAGLGDDIVLGGGGDDRLFGAPGDDTLFGGGGNDRLLGGAGDDTLAGGGGDDIVRGGAGSDTIIAGAGRDALVGGAGSDVFRFGRGSNDVIDQVVDFDPSEDIVELRRGLLPGSGLSGTLTAADFATVTTLGSGSDAKIIYETSTGLVYYNSGRAGSTPVALLNLGKDLSVSADAFQIV